MSQKEFVDYSQEMAHMNSSYRKSINEDAVRYNLRSLFENADTGGGYYHENNRNRSQYAASKVVHQPCIRNFSPSERAQSPSQARICTARTKGTSARSTSTFPSNTHRLLEPFPTASTTEDARNTE